MRRREARHRIGQLADALALGDVLDRRARELSGGQQRRLQAATAMVHRPRLLLLDELTVGADPLTRDALLAVVRAAAADGAAVVYTTHYRGALTATPAQLRRPLAMLAFFALAGAGIAGLIGVGQHPPAIPSRRHRRQQ